MLYVYELTIVDDWAQHIGTKRTHFQRCGKVSTLERTAGNILVVFDAQHLHHRMTFLIQAHVQTKVPNGTDPNY